MAPLLIRGEVYQAKWVSGRAGWNFFRICMRREWMDVTSDRWSLLQDEPARTSGAIQLLQTFHDLFGLMAAQQFLYLMA